MDSQPWYQKRKLDPVFPFLLWEAPMLGFSLHWHELIEIAYVRSGNLAITVQGRAYRANQGDIVFINPSAVHGFSSSAPDTRMILVQFGLELFDESLIDLRDRQFQKLVFERKTHVTNGEDADMHRRLENHILEMRREYEAKEEGFRLAIKANLYELTLLLLRRVPARQLSAGEAVKRRQRNELLERIFAFVHDNFRRPLDLADAAAAAHLSKFYFSRFFKELTGQTFHAYLSSVRVGHAEEMLARTDVPITEIAYSSGFSSLETFNRIFRTYAGTTPSCYRDGRRRAAEEQFLTGSRQ